MTEFDLGCNQASIWHACQCRWAGVNAELLAETPAHEPRGLQGEGVMPRPALGNHPAKQPSGAWHRQQCGSTHPPAESPTMVTLLGSPPKAAMFSCNHSIAAIW